MGAAVALAAPVGDLFESMIKRDLEVKDTGRLFGPHGGVLDRLDAVFFTVVGHLLRGGRVRVRLGTLPTLNRVRKVLIVGSTGSIGTQALEVVERAPSSRSSAWPPLRAGSCCSSRQAVSAWTASRSPIPTPRRERASTPAARAAGRGAGGADRGDRLRSRAERPRRVRRAGADGRHAGRGDRPRAGQQGEPRGGRGAGDGAGGGHRRPADPGGLRALRAVPAACGRAAGHGRPAGAHGERRAVPRPHRPGGRDRARRRSPTRPGTWAGRSRSTRPR